MKIIIVEIRHFTHLFIEFVEAMNNNCLITIIIIGIIGT